MKVKPTVPLIVSFILVGMLVPFVGASGSCQISNLTVMYPGTVNSGSAFSVVVSFSPVCTGNIGAFRVEVLDGNGNVVGQTTSSVSTVFVVATFQGKGPNLLIVQILLSNGSTLGETGWTGSINVA